MKIIENKTSVDNREKMSGSAISVMQHNMQFANSSEVGIFWYNVGKDELFDVYSTPAEDAEFYTSVQWGCKVKTDKRLHKDIWKKKKRSGDHTMIPRGRVFQFESGEFVVFTGSWIYDYPSARELIINEFNLPEENTEFRVDSHWDIGHGWSDEF